MRIDIDPAVQIQNEIRHLKVEHAAVGSHPTREHLGQPNTVGHTIVVVIHGGSACAEGWTDDRLRPAILQHDVREPLVVVVKAIVGLGAKLGSVNNDIAGLSGQNRGAVGAEIGKLARIGAACARSAQNPIARHVTTVLRLWHTRDDSTIEFDRFCHIHSHRRGEQRTAARD